MNALGLLLLICSSVLAMDLGHLKPGCLMGEKGKVFLLENHVVVEIPFQDIITVPDQLLLLSDQLTDTLQIFKGGIYTQTNAAEGKEHELANLIADKISLFNFTIRSTWEKYHAEEVKAKRGKRGLFNGIGYLTRSLFGTAMDKDVQTLTSKYNKMLEWAHEADKVITLNNNNLEQLKQNLHKLHQYTALPTNSINKLSARVDELFTVSEVLLIMSSVEHFLQQVNQRNEALLNNVIDAALNQVTSSLLSFRDLRLLLQQAEEKYSLLPIFSGAEIVYYYPLLSAIIASESIVVSIPFKSSHQYSLYELVPFPMSVNNSLYSLDLSSSLLLTNEDRTEYTLTTERKLDSCHTAHEGFYFCSASEFAFIPVREAGVCELSVFLNNSSRSLELCPFKEVPRTSFYHQTFQGYHYFMFPDPVEVTVRCAEGNTYKRVQGPLRIMKDCSLSSLSVSSIPEVTHHGVMPSHPEFVHQLNFNVSNIHYVTNKLHQLYLQNVTSFKRAIHSNLPTYLQPSTHLPLTVTMSVIIMVIICILIYISCVRKSPTSMCSWIWRRSRPTISHVGEMTLVTCPSTTTVTSEAEDNPVAVD